MTHEEKETPGGATPGAIGVKELTSLLNQIDRNVPGLTIRFSRKLKPGKGNDNLRQGSIHVSKKGRGGLFYRMSPLHFFAKLRKPRME